MQEVSDGCVVPDVDGRVAQDLAVTVPAAVGGAAAAGRVVSADLAEDLPLAVLLQVQLQVRVALAVARREAETPHALDLHKRQVELLRHNEGGGTGNERAHQEVTGYLRPGQTWSSLLVCRRRCLRKSKREHFRTRMRSVVPSAR